MNFRKPLVLISALTLCFTLNLDSKADTPLDKPLYIKVNEKSMATAEKMFINKDSQIYKDKDLKELKGYVLAGGEVTTNNYGDVSYIKEYSGYIKNTNLDRKLTFEKTNGEITINHTAYLYEKMDISSKILEKIKEGGKISYDEKLDNWYVLNIDGKKGYIYYRNTKDTSNSVSIEDNYIDDVVLEETNLENSSENRITQSEGMPQSIQSFNETYDSNLNINHANIVSKSGKKLVIDYSNPKQKEIVEKALQYEGTRYIWGGNSLTYGIDCSGFTRELYKLFGYSIPRYSGHQRSVGVSVSKNSMQAGDILCFDGHVSMYIGNGMMIHASTPQTGVIITPVTYGGHYIKTVRRLFT